MSGDRGNSRHQSQQSEQDSAPLFASPESGDRAPSPVAAVTPATQPTAESIAPGNASYSYSRAEANSNALDIDQVLAPHYLRNRLPPPITYQQATEGDAPAVQQLQQQQQQPTNEVAIDDVNFYSLEGALQHTYNSSSTTAAGQAGAESSSSSSTSHHHHQQQQWQPLLRQLGRPVGGGMPDFPSGGLELIKHLNLDGIFLENKDAVVHDVVRQPDDQQEQRQQQGRQRHRAQQQQQQQQQDGATVGPTLPTSARHPSTRSSSSRKHKQQQQQQQAPQLQYSQPRPHPLYLKPRHVKTHFKIPTSDGWKLHLIRTQVQNVPPSHHHPVILCPGLGSSGAYSFDLSPNVSLADYLAGKGWDVWTCELRGNGMSDKPGLFSKRSRWWTIDDYVEKDVPAIIRFVLKETHRQQVHFLGHSMGGMILCGVMARVDITTAKIRSCIAIGSGLFLEESWWRLFERFKALTHTFWIMPSGTLLRTYARFMFGPYRIPYIDMLYFWPSNVDPHVGRAMMRRNFSNVSVGVIQQMLTAFGSTGLLSADKKVVYADPGRLAKVQAPALFLVGDRDRMCPPDGARKTWQMLGSPHKRFICLGPAAGFSDHYGHFDILMGKRVEREVFPIIHDFLLQNDTPKPLARL